MKRVYVTKILKSTREEPVLEELVREYHGYGMSVSGRVDGILLTGRDVKDRRSYPYRVRFVRGIESPIHVPYLAVRCKYVGRKREKVRKLEKLLKFAKMERGINFVLSSDREVLITLKSSRKRARKIIDEINSILPIRETHFIFCDFGLENLERLLHRNC